MSDLTRNKILVTKMNLFRCTVGAVGLLAFVFFVQKLSPTVAFMDSMRYLTYYANSLEGKSSIFSTWNQGEHRGLLVQLGVYFNALMFGFSVKAAVYMCGVVLLLTGLLLTKRQQATLSHRRDISRVLLASVFVVTFLGLFSFSNWELYSLDVGVFLFAKNLIFIVFWIAIQKALTDEPFLYKYKWALFISVVLIILTVAYGWVYAFAIATMASIYIVDPIDKPFKKFRFELVIVILLSLGMYVAGGQMVSSDMGGSHIEGGKLVNSIYGVFFAISSIFLGQETSVALGISSTYRVIFASVFMLLCAIVTLQDIGKARAELLLPYVLVFYSGLHIIGVSYARGKIDPVFAMAPRYYLDFSLLILGVYWLFLMSDIDKSLRKLTPILIYSFLGVFVVGQLFTSLDELRKAPYRHASFEKMRDATLAGDISAEQARLLQQPLAMAQKAIQVQRKYNLGPYRALKCEVPYFTDNIFPDHWVGQGTSFLLKNCGSLINIEFYVPEQFSSRQIKVVIDGQMERVVEVLPGSAKKEIFHSSSSGSFYNVKLSVDVTQKPSDLIPTSSDDRNLGVIISNIGAHD